MGLDLETFMTGLQVMGLGSWGIGKIAGLGLVRMRHRLVILPLSQTLVPQGDSHLTP